MPTRIWEFQLEGIQHLVEINYNIFSGKLVIRADGQYVSSKRVFNLFGYPCEVGINLYKNRFYYCLIVNNEFIDDSRNRVFSKNWGVQKKNKYSPILSFG
jgi:hypothetical protein